MLRINTQTLFCLSLLTHFSCMYSMEPEKSIWDTLVKEARIKVFAYADWETKFKMYYFWPKMFACTMNDLLQEPPVRVSRKCFLFHLIDMARSENKEGFCKLLPNDTYCDSALFLPDVCFFVPKESEVLNMIELYRYQRDNGSLKQVLPHIMEVCKRDKTIWQKIGFKQEFNPLHNAILREDSSVIIELLILQNPEWINSKHKNQTPLYMAVKKENTLICKSLLSFEHIKIDELSEDIQSTAIGWCGTEPGERISRESMTPLMYAASRGLFEFVQILVKHGADINCQNSNKKTALYFALEQKRRNDDLPPNFKQPNINKMVNFLLAQPNFVYGPHDEKLLEQVTGSQNQKNNQSKTRKGNRNEPKEDNCVCM